MATVWVLKRWRKIRYAVINRSCSSGWTPLEKTRATISSARKRVIMRSFPRSSFKTLIVDRFRWPPWLEVIRNDYPDISTLEQLTPVLPGPSHHHAIPGTCSRPYRQGQFHHQLFPSVSGQQGFPGSVTSFQRLLSPCPPLWPGWRHTENSVRQGILMSRPRRSGDVHRRRCGGVHSIQGTCGRFLHRR